MGVGLQARVGKEEIELMRVHPNSSDTLRTALQAVGATDPESCWMFSAGPLDNNCPGLDLKSVFWSIFSIIEITFMGCPQTEDVCLFFPARQLHAYVHGDKPGIPTVMIR